MKSSIIFLEEYQFCNGKNIFSRCQIISNSYTNDILKLYADLIINFLDHPDFFNEINEGCIEVYIYIYFQLIAEYLRLFWLFIQLIVFMIQLKYSKRLFFFTDLWYFFSSFFNIVCIQYIW